MGDPSEPEDGGELRIRFFTKQAWHTVTDTPIAVPLQFRRAHLSQMINHLLQLEPAKPFDFLINGEFLRVSLEKFAEQHGLFTEEVLAVEYMEALAPPEPATEFLHDDWISAVTGNAAGLFATGSFDHAARVWNSSGELMATLKGHEDVVSGVAWVPADAEAGADQSHCLVTSSLDETLRQWTIDSDGEAHCDCICRDHTNAVRSVAVQPTGRMFASGSTDSTIRLWTSSVEASSRLGKRRKTDAEGAPPTEKRALGQLSGSTAAVTALVWAERDRVLSAGEDHCIRQWDVETATNVRTFVSSKVINDLAYSLQSNLIASADFDAHIRIYDPRSTEGTVVKCTLSSHRRPVSGVRWSPTDPHQLVSASYDDGESNNLKLWDVRSRKIPIHNIAGHTGKIFAVDWPTAHVILSGGEDTKLKVHKWEPTTTDQEKGK